MKDQLAETHDHPRTLGPPPPSASLSPEGLRASSIDIESLAIDHSRTRTHSRNRNSNVARDQSLRHKDSRNSIRSTTTAHGTDTSDGGRDADGMIELRRKDHSVQDSAAAQANRLVDAPEFSLDDYPSIDSPAHGQMEYDHDYDGADSAPNPNASNQQTGQQQNTTSFRDLPPADQRNFLLLCLLYFLQGIPMGLATGSVPFLLKPFLSYGQIGIFSLASYPYSLKLFWSPIVDALWHPGFGRRKSWITPIQTISGLSMIYLGSQIDTMMKAAGANNGAGVWGFTGWWFLLVFLSATQDIAVDGWAISLLSAKNVAYASTAQTVGLTAGQFLSYTVFLAFNSSDFANKWFRSQPEDAGLLSLGGYLKFWGWMYLIITVLVAVFKREERNKNREGIGAVYKSMWGVLNLKNIQTLIIVHLIAKIGFIANDAVTNLKLLDKKFGQENMALVVLIDFPFEIALGYYAGKWSTQYGPMRLWCWAFMGRLGAALFAHFTVAIFPLGYDGPPGWYIFIVILEHVASTFMSTVMFVAISAYHARIADPQIGGTYMTLLATVSNLGGTFPRFFVLKLVDLFTSATCMPPTSPPSPASLKPDTTPVTSPFSCSLEADKHRCVDGGGTCVVHRDGYYTTNLLCVVFGIATFLWYIRPEVLKLQRLPLRAWRVSSWRGR